jgi:hypothetical protein
MEVADLPELPCIAGELRIQEVALDLTFPLYLVYFAAYKQEMDDEGNLVKQDRDPLISRFERSLDVIKHLKGVRIGTETEEMVLRLKFPGEDVDLLDTQCINVMEQFESVIEDWNIQQRQIDERAIDWFNEQKLAPAGSLDFETLADEMF